MLDRPSDRWLCRFSIAACLLLLATPVPAHTIDCSGRAGIELARCERHQKMAALCGPVKGDAHYACDREFLLANPLACDTLSGDDAKRCTAESAALKACEAQQGRDFMRCAGDRIKASPLGQP